MKKITSIFSALLLAGIGFAANATAPKVVSVTPQQGNVAVNGLQQIVITFDVAIQDKDGGSEIDATIDQAPGGYQGYSLYGEISGKTLTLLGGNCGNGRLAGTYVFNIPAANITDLSGIPMEENLTLTYEVVEPQTETAQLSVTPAVSVLKGSNNTLPADYTPNYQASDLNKIVLTAPDYAMDFSSSKGMITCNLVGEQPTELNYRYVTKVSGMPGNPQQYPGTFTLDLSSFEPGVYEINIPEGFVAIKQTNVNKVNAALTLTYAITPAAIPNMTQQATIVAPTDPYPTEINEVTISWGVDITAGANINDITVDVPQNSFLGVASVVNNQLVVNFSNDDSLVDLPGEITIKLPEGAVVNNAGGMNNAQNLVIYRYGVNEYTTVNPSLGNVMAANLSQIVVTYSDDMQINTNNSEQIVAMVGSTSQPITGQVNGNQLTFSIGGAANLADGTEVTVTIPQAYLVGKTAKVVNKGAVLKYTVSSTVVPNVYPAANISFNYSDIDQLVTISLKNGGEMTNNSTQISQNPFIQKVGGSEINVSNYISFNEKYSAMYIDLSKVVNEQGQYMLFIPEGYLLISDNSYTNAESPAIQETFTVGIVSSVDGINAEEGAYRVYNLQGVKIMEGKDLNGLANGLYIINGKKVAIRK